LVYIVVLVLVVCLCPSSAHVVAETTTAALSANPTPMSTKAMAS